MTTFPTNKIHLPKTVLGRRSGFNYVKLVQRISARRIPYGIEGPVYRPGAAVERDVLGKNAVALELAGSVPPAPPRRRPNECVWVLWQFDGSAWSELGRAQSSDWTWQLALREPIAEALKRTRPLLDITGAAEAIVERLVTDLDKALEYEGLPVMMAALSRLNDHVQARMCRAEDEFQQPIRIGAWAG